MKVYAVMKNWGCDGEYYDIIGVSTDLMGARKIIMSDIGEILDATEDITTISKYQIDISEYNDVYLRIFTEYSQNVYWYSIDDFELQGS